MRALDLGSKVRLQSATDDPDLLSDGMHRLLCGTVSAAISHTRVLDDRRLLPEPTNLLMYALQRRLPMAPQQDLVAVQVIDVQLELVGAVLV